MTFSLTFYKIDIYILGDPQAPFCPLSAIISVSNWLSISSFIVVDSSESLVDNPDLVVLLVVVF